MRAKFIQKLVSFFEPSIVVKRRESRERRLRYLLSLENIPDNIANQIKTNRVKYGVTPELIRIHFNHGERFPKTTSNLRPHTLKCTCPLCKWTDLLRSLKAEKLRLQRIYTNIEEYSELKGTFQLKRHEDVFRNFKFSDFFKNNLPLYFENNNIEYEKPIFIKVTSIEAKYPPTIPKIVRITKNPNKPVQVTEKAVLKVLGDRCLELYGPNAHLIYNNLQNIDKNIEKIEKRIKKFKLLVNI